jgi:hypothetical protein
MAGCTDAFTRRLPGDRFANTTLVMRSPREFSNKRANQRSV